MQPQSAYPENRLAYFESQALSGHPLRGLPEGSASIPQVGKGTGTGSPPPHSATTSGSTSTPTSPSIGGLSSSVESSLKPPEHSNFHPHSINEDPSRYDQNLQNHADGSWGPMSVGMMGQNYDPEHGTSAPSGLRTDQSESQGGRYSASAYPSAVKILVSNNVAGSIIGRAGQTISELQSHSSARIKLSQTGDFYPGTQDRVCLVQGQLENVKTAVRLLLERLHMLQEQQHSQQMGWQPKPHESSPTGFDFVVRILVPSSSCGMLIGKSGSNIKSMEETSGVSSVRLSPKETGDPSSPTGAILAATSERVVTLTGPTLDSCLSCLHIVLDGMSTHHEICRYSNMTTSYSRVVVHGAYGSMPPVPPGPPVGRPVDVVPNTGPGDSTMWEGAGPSYGQLEVSKRSSSSPDINAQLMWEQRASQGLQVDPPSAQIGRPPMGVEQYRPVFPEGPQSFAPDISHTGQSGTRASSISASSPPVYLLSTPNHNQIEQSSVSNSVSAPDLLAMQLQDTLRINTAQTAAAPVEYNHFASQLPQPTPPGFTAQVLVPDPLIGSILGRGGRTLNELQMHSGTRIRISQRGEYVPGTRNRIVTIRGPTAHSVSVAQYLMSQRMVLPPTAAYASTPPAFHPPTIQAQEMTPLQHQQQRHLYDSHPAQYNPNVHGSGFQPNEPAGQHPTSSGTLPQSGSKQDFTH